MTFSAQPAEGASCRVNRKNLGAGGSATLFLLTVTAEDGESKRVYQVTVHRQEKEEEEKPTLSQDARLLSLTPEQGQLSPAFDPEVLEYRLTVPFEVTTMTFAAQPAEGASCRVNRKNLGAGGSSTLFTLTVTAEDGTAKRVYQVTVYRQEKAAAASPSPTRTPSPVSVGSAGTSRPASSSTARPVREETPAPVQSAPVEEASAAPALGPRARHRGGRGNAVPFQHRRRLRRAGPSERPDHFAAAWAAGRGAVPAGLFPVRPHRPVGEPALPRFWEEAPTAKKMSRGKAAPPL